MPRGGRRHRRDAARAAGRRGPRSRARRTAWSGPELLAKGLDLRAQLVELALDALDAVVVAHHLVTRGFRISFFMCLGSEQMRVALLALAGAAVETLHE